MKNWQKYFATEILERGLNYYKSNAVRIYNSSNTCIDAQVAGSIIYDLRIDFKDSQIDSMYCNCPYYDNCKHLAATLYYIEDHPELLRESEDITDLVLSMTQGEMVEFLLEEVQKNPDLSNRLKLFMNQDVDVEYYQNKLRMCFGNSLDVLNFIDDDLYDLKEANQIDLILTLSKSIVKYCEELVLYGQYDAFDGIIVKIDDLMNRLLNIGFEDEVCDFLEEMILTSDDESVLDLFTDTYSRYRSVEKLFDEHFDKNSL